MSNGICRGPQAQHIELTNAEYHARPEWSNSQLKLLPQKPELFYGRFITKQFPPPAGKSLDVGTIVHSVLLEGGGVPVIPADVLNAQGHRKGKDWLAYKAEHEGEPLLTLAEAAPLIRMTWNAAAEPRAAALLAAEGPVEHSIVWTDAESGLLRRARPDKIVESDEGRLLLDVKTTQCDPTSEREWANEVAKYQYHRQAAWYWDAVEAFYGKEPAARCFIVLGNTPPYSCVVRELAGRAIELGRQENRAALLDLAGRLQTNNWYPRGYGHVQVCDLPQWKYDKEENENHDD